MSSLIDFDLDIFDVQKGTRGGLSNEFIYAPRVDELNNLRVSGVFSTRDPDAALDVITKTLPVEQVRLTDYLVLIR